MNKRVLTALFLMGALVAPGTFVSRAVAHDDRQDQSRNQDQRTDQERNRHQEQERQSWNGDYRYEDTADREYLKHRRHAQQGQDRSWDADYRNEDTADRNWLNEHKPE